MYKEKILQEAVNQGVTSAAQVAYILATALHETNKTMEPVKEAYWLSETWRKNNLRYYPYYGRGFVQLTWKANYKKYSKILDIDLVSDPDKVMDPDISAFIIVHGMKHGTFTGKSLDDFITKNSIDFYNARKIINGLDKARTIETLAKSYLTKLQDTRFT